MLSYPLKFHFSLSPFFLIFFSIFLFLLDFRLVQRRRIAFLGPDEILDGLSK